MTIHTYLSSTPGLRGNAREFAAHERLRVRAAAQHARRVYPGRVGELLYRELVAYADFGYRFGAGGLVPKLVTEILATPAPHPVPELGEAC